MAAAIRCSSSWVLLLVVCGGVGRCRARGKGALALGAFFVYLFFVFVLGSVRAPRRTHLVGSGRPGGGGDARGVAAALDDRSVRASRFVSCLFHREMAA